MRHIAVIVIALCLSNSAVATPACPARPLSPLSNLAEIPPLAEIPGGPDDGVPTPDQLRLERPTLPPPAVLRRQQPAFPSPAQLMRERPAIPPPAALRRSAPAVPLPKRPAVSATPRSKMSTPRTHVIELHAGEARVVSLLNITRRRSGLTSLRIDPLATRVARAHSEDMCRRRFFDHRSPDGSAPWHRLRRSGARFQAAAENIALGYRTATAVHQGWMTSAGHRKNRMSSKYTRIGVGKYVCGSTIYWTELFLR